MLSTEVARRHKNAFHFTPKARFDSAVSDLDRRIPELRGYEIMIGMMRILSMIGDGHTRSDDLFNSFSQFPLDLYWFGSELRVVRTMREYKAALGGKVIAIGSTPIAVADQKVRSLIEKHETEGWVKRFSAYYLSSPEILKYFGIIPDLECGTYLIDNGAGAQSVSFEPIPYNAEPEYLDAATRIPLYRENVKNVWFRYLDEAKLAYLAFNHYPSVEDFRHIASSLFATVDAHPGSALVIDFRNNGGGDYIRFDEILLDGFKKRKWLYEQGHLFGLIGRNTFSAAMMNALQLRQQMHAILVGEPTGARPNSYNEAAHFVLPNSHFEGYIFTVVLPSGARQSSRSNPRQVASSNLGRLPNWRRSCVELDNGQDARPLTARTDEGVHSQLPLTTGCRSQSRLCRPKIGVLAELSAIQK